MSGVYTIILYNDEPFLYVPTQKSWSAVTEGRGCSNGEVYNLHFLWPPPPGGKPEELGRSIRVGVHLEYRCNLFQNVLRWSVEPPWTCLLHKTKKNHWNVVLGHFSMTPGGKPEELSQSQGEGYIFNIYIIYSKRFYVDRLNLLGQDHCTKLRKISKNAVWGHILWPLGQTGSARCIYLWNTVGGAMF